MRSDLIGALGFGAFAVGCLIIGFCLRYSRTNGDRHYAYFALGFWIAGLSWTGLALAIVVGFDLGRRWFQ